MDVDRLRTELLAWQLCLPSSAVFTHLTGAALRGWWLPPLPENVPIFVSMGSKEPRPRRQGLKVSRHPSPPIPDLVRAVRCAAAAETIRACARDLSLLDLVVMIDSALHFEHVGRAELDAVASERRRGGPQLRRALAYVDGRSESAWETLLRVLHKVCDIDVVPQHELFDSHGTFVARGDLWLMGTIMFHEYDGGEHLKKQRQRADLKRARRIGTAAWQRRGYTSDDVLHQPIGILRDADDTLAREHDPGRIRSWNALLRESCFTPAGLTRLSQRLDRPAKVVTPSQPEP